MKKLITLSTKHLLYKDECHCNFFITKTMEIYRFSKDNLGCLCWSPKIVKQLQEKGIVKDYWKLDDGLYDFKVLVQDLPILLSCGIHKRRIHRRGKWLRKREKQLGHKIYKYNIRIPNNKVPLQLDFRTLYDRYN